jgi:GNAT superfamily N-acetyltransferase
MRVGIIVKLLDRNRGARQAQTPARPQVQGIRRRKAGDLAMCGRLLDVVHYDARYPALRPEPPRAWLDSPDVHDAWVCERVGRILGHVAVSDLARDSLSALRWRETTERSPSELMAVSRFFVRPTARQLGIGTALLDVAVAEIRRQQRLPVLEMITARRDGFPYLASRGWRLVAIDAWGPRDQGLHICRYMAPREQPGT